RRTSGAMRARVVSRSERSPTMRQYCLGMGAPAINRVSAWSRVPSPPASTRAQRRSAAGVSIRRFRCGDGRGRFGRPAERARGPSASFAALRAAGEKFGLVKGSDQTLDANDLKVLEQKIGLKMRVGGVGGQDRDLGSVGVTQINLGAASATESKAAAAQDRQGNLIQQQAGATFTINGAQRGYVDGWFGDHGRAA